MFSQKQQQQIDALCAASIRALTGLGDLHHRGRKLFLAAQAVNINAPHLFADRQMVDFHAHRGIADGIALALQFRDPSLHQSLCPKHGLQKLLFELLEQLRVESLVGAHYPGMQSNLYYRFRQWSLAFHLAGHTETQIGLLIYTLAQLSWSRLSGHPTLPETDELIESTRSVMSPIIGKQLMGLRKSRAQQSDYAKHALCIVQMIADSLHTEMDRHNQSRKAREDEKALSRITLRNDFSDDTEDSNLDTVVTGCSRVLGESHQTYRVFTTRYDQEYVPATKIRLAELEDLRNHLDHQVRNQCIHIPRLCRQISILLSTPQYESRLFGEEDGIIDGRRLTQLIASPAERRLFYRTQYDLKSDCLVTLLIDCSGSMKAQIEWIAILTDIFSRALDQVGVSNEILGFSTASWNGGKTLKDWQAKGQPQNPGRLNERSHLIFKTADRSWRRSRKDIAALLKTTDFREGLDGEALDWCCRRMGQRDEKRKIVLVISDGSPMDSMTNLHNNPYYLDDHLQQVVHRYDGKSGIEIYGIGLGLDTSHYYRRSITIDSGESLSHALFKNILQTIAQPQKPLNSLNR